MSNNLHFLKQLVNNKINNYKVEYKYAQNIDERDKLLKSIEILGTYLFLINIKLGSHHLFPINGLLKK